MASFQIVSQSQRCGDLATYTDVTRCGLRIMNLIAPVKKGNYNDAIRQRELQLRDLRFLLWVLICKFQMQANK
ncbi:hypothetical protein M8J75_012063 [Diaphorina citri]|nr:hypothetical protein M8J75_012063 [Diaphorina citri]